MTLLMDCKKKLPFLPYNSFSDTMPDSGKPMRTLITTVGISLLTNFSKFVGRKPDETLPDAQILANWANKAGWQKASAETNTWHLLGVDDNQGDEPIKVVLFPSDSPEGNLCVEVLTLLAMDQNIEAIKVRVQNLSAKKTTESAHFNRGLAHLARAIINAVHNGQARGGYVEIVATGGYKPETSIAHQLGSLLGVSVHYIHENQSQVVTLDPLPVSLDLAWVQGPGESLLGYFNGDKHDLVRLDKLDSLLKKDSRLNLLLDVDHDSNLAGLSLLGEMALAMLKRPAVRWPEVCNTAPQDKIHVSPDHHWPKGYQAWLDQIAGIGYVTNIRFEGSAMQGSRMIGPAPDSHSDLLGTYVDNLGCRRGVRIATTATNASQQSMIENLLKKDLSRFG